MSSGIEAVVAVTDLVAECEVNVWVVESVEKAAVVDPEDARDEDDYGESDDEECERECQP